MGSCVAHLIILCPMTNSVKEATVGSVVTNMVFINSAIVLTMVFFTQVDSSSFGTIGVTLGLISNKTMRKGKSSFQRNHCFKPLWVTR